MSKVIKSKFKECSKFNRTFFQNSKTATNLIILNQIFKESPDLILDAKEQYTIKTNQKLNDPLTAPKIYWSILNRFLTRSKFFQYHLYSLTKK